MMITSTRSSSCCASCTTTTNPPVVAAEGLFSDSNSTDRRRRGEQTTTKQDDEQQTQIINTGGHSDDHGDGGDQKRQRLFWTEQEDDTRVVYSSGLGTLNDRLRRHHQRRSTLSGTIANKHWPAANVSIHHRGDSRQLEKQPPPIDHYHTLQGPPRHRRSTAGIDHEAGRAAAEQQEVATPRKPLFPHLSLLRRRGRRRSSPPADDERQQPTSEKKASLRQQLLQLTNMGQRFGRQQEASPSQQPPTIPEVRTPSDEDKSTTAAVRSSSLRLRAAVGQQQQQQQYYHWTPAMSGCSGGAGGGGSSYGAPWWACAPLNGPIQANDHYYHQYLCRQPYATIMKNRVVVNNNGGSNGGSKSHLPPPLTLQERQQQLRDLMIGDRLANFYDAQNDYGFDRHGSPCRQIVDARTGFDLLRRADKRQLADIPATPRLVRSNRVRQQTTTNSPLASQQLVQQQQHQNRHQTNGGNYGYWPADDYYSSPPSGGTFTPTPSPPIPPRPPLQLCPDWTDSRQTSRSATSIRGGGNVPNGLLEPPPPTPEEAEDCLAKHLRVICHEQASMVGSPQWSRKQRHDPNVLGSTDVLLNSNYSSQHSVVQMPSNHRHMVPRPAPPPPPPSSSHLHHPHYPHPSSSSSNAVAIATHRQSQESLMSLMSTSTTSMAVPLPRHHQQQQQQHGGGSSVGSQSPSVLIRGAHFGRHSHHYGAGHHHRGAPSSSCGSSSRGSSECSFNIIGHRRHMYRRSARNLNVRIPYLDNAQSAGRDGGGGLKSTSAAAAAPAAAGIMLKGLQPLPFEVPCVESSSTMDASTIFVGREWIFHELYEILVKSTTPDSHAMKGAVIYGGVGTGKTAVVHQLASYSPFLVSGGEHQHDDDGGHDSPSVSPYCPTDSPSSDRVARGVSANNGGQAKNRTSNSTDSGFVSGSKLSLNNKNGLGPPSSTAGPSRFIHHQHQHQQQQPPPPPRPPLPDWHRSVCQSVVAYHFCQIENQVTCQLADFLRNLASMFACSPQLTAYRDHLHQQPKLQRLLTSSSDELWKNPIRAFRAAVTDPLVHLRKCGKIGAGNFLILIDGLDEAEFHRPEFGESVGSFLVKHAVTLLPEWMKLVLTIKTASVDVLKGLPLHKISLDDTVIDEWVFKDAKEYVRLRIGQSSTIQTNISNTKAPSNENGPPIPQLSTTSGSTIGQDGVGASSSTSSTSASCPLSRFSAHLASGSKGNFLYMKTTLNLIEKNYLVMKGANYKVLPINLSEVFLLMFNLRFSTARKFEQVAPLLNAVLASLRPMNADQLYEAVSAGVINEKMTKEDFDERMKFLDDYLVKKQDGTYVLFHPSFRDWLIRREDGQSPKFLCDLRYGHALLALRLSRSGHRLSAVEMQELGHHLLKAHIYKRSPSHGRNEEESESGATAAAVAALFGRDCQLVWLNQVAADLRSALCTQRNVCYPNSKVSKLLLLAGASADAPLVNFCLDETSERENDDDGQHHQRRSSTPLANEYATLVNDNGSTPILCSAAFYGQQEFATLLLEFNADVGVTESYKGRSPLMLAAAEGHLDMVQMLHQHGAKLSQIDNEHRCALVYAAERGHAHIVSFLLQCDWTELGGSENHRTINSSGGDYSTPKSTNMASSTYGYALRQQAAQQAFVAAASAGRTSICEFLLDFGDVLVDEADPVGGETALSAACASARKETVGFLLNRAGARAAYGRQAEKPTPPLLQAVANGCWEIVSTLLARQIEVDGERNGTGQTALMIAAQFGHMAVLELLLSRNVDVSATDDDGRTALYWACLKDQPAAASLLLDRGASLDTFDKHGFGPIHYAAQHGSKQLMQLLLDRSSQLLELPTNSSAHLRPLDLAILADNVEAVQRCLKKGAKLAPSTWTFARDKLSMIAALLNKLLEDGQLLYKKDRLQDAQHRFTYALKKLPQSPASTTSPGTTATTDDASASSSSSYAAQWSEYAHEFDRLRFHLQLNYARCQRKSGEPSKAADTCTNAIRSYQQALLSPSTPRRHGSDADQALVDAYVCRARCFCELHQFEKASEDLRRALRVSPTNREAQHMLPKVKLALEKETGGGGGAKLQKEETSSSSKMNKIELNSGSSLLSVYTPPQSSRESSVPTVTTDGGGEANGGDRKNASAAVSPNRSQASSDSGNMPDMDDGEHHVNKTNRIDLDLPHKRDNGVETQL